MTKDDQENNSKQENEIPDVFRDKFDEDEAESIAQILKIAKRYSEGDAFAGAKIKNIDPDVYEGIEEVFRDSGCDVVVGNRMDLVNLVSRPDTGDDELDTAIKQL